MVRWYKIHSANSLLHEIYNCYFKNKIRVVLYKEKKTEAFQRLSYLVDYPRNSEPEAYRHQPYKKLKHTQTIRRLLLTNCLSVFDYFIGLVLKVLSKLFMTCKLTILQTLKRQA